MQNTLMQITGEYQELLDILSITDPDDEELKVIEDTLEAVKGEIEVKADYYVFVIKNLEAQAAAKKELGKMLINASKQLEDHAAKLKERIKYCMEVMGVKEIEGNYFKYKIQKNGGKQELIYRKDVTVPQNYQRIIYEDNDKVRKALEAGETLPFAYLEERGTHLRIK